MATFKINFRSLHIQATLFISHIKIEEKLHCLTPKARSEFLTLRIKCLKYQAVYSKCIT